MRPSLKSRRFVMRVVWAVLLGLLGSQGGLGADTPPRISTIGNWTLRQNGTSGPIPFAIADADTPVGDLVLAVTTDNPTLLPASGLVLGGSGGGRTLTIRPASDQSGTARVRVRVTDPGAGTSSTLFTVTVLANTPPRISTIGEWTLDEDCPSTIPFAIADAETRLEDLVLVVTTDIPAVLPASGLLLGGSGALRSLTISPEAHQSGTGHVRVRVIDGSGAWASTLFGVKVRAVNDAPTISAIANHSLPRGSASEAISFTVGDVETPAADLRLVATADNAGLIPPGAIALGGSGALRTVTIQPSPGLAGSARICLQVLDAQEASSTASFTLKVGQTSFPSLSPLPSRTLRPGAAEVIPFQVGDAETPASELTVTATADNPALLSSLTCGGSGADRSLTVAAGPSSGVCHIRVEVRKPDGTPRSSVFTLHVSDLPSLSVFAGIPSNRGNADGVWADAKFLDPCGVCADASGNFYVADTGNHTIRKITPDGVVSTLAGLAGVSGTADGIGAQARFNHPSGVVVDGSGYLYVADSDNSAIRKITPSGTVSTLAGLPASSGSSDGSGSVARFDRPWGLALDASGNLYVADTYNHTIRKIEPSGLVSTLAGLAKLKGSADGAGVQARFYYPKGVALDASGHAYVTDSSNCTVRKITPGGVVSTLAGLARQSGAVDGPGSQARFGSPAGITVGSGGVVYVSDSRIIRAIASDGLVSTLAGSPGLWGEVDGQGAQVRFVRPQGLTMDASGEICVVDAGSETLRRISLDGVVRSWLGMLGKNGSADGIGPMAKFNSPNGVAMDASGNAYVADTMGCCIRKITPDGSVSTLAGSIGQPGSADGTGAQARFSHPQGVAVDASGHVYVADSMNYTVRKITPGGVVSTLAGLAGKVGIADGPGSQARFAMPQGIAVDSAGNVYVSDFMAFTIRKITPGGVVSTLAGMAWQQGCVDGTGSEARFQACDGLAVDAWGNVHLADSHNHVIRKITPAGVVTTPAGSLGQRGSSDGTLAQAMFNSPAGVTIDGLGNLLVAEGGNGTIRKITPSGVVSTLVGVPGLQGMVPGPLPASLLGPRWLAVEASTGNLLISDSSAILKVTF